MFREAVHRGGFSVVALSRVREVGAGVHPKDADLVRNQAGSTDSQVVV